MKELNNEAHSIKMKIMKIGRLQEIFIKKCEKNDIIISITWKNKQNNKINDLNDRNNRIENNILSSRNDNNDNNC